MPPLEIVEASWAARPTRLDPNNCYEARLQAVIDRDPGCMARYNFGPTSSRNETELPVYVVHAPFLLERGRSIRQQLAALQVTDATFVHCANKNDVGAFSSEDRQCLHPCYALTHYIQQNEASRQFKTLHDGTLSLALKHKLVYHDLIRRKLHAALVLEDDAILPPPPFVWSDLSVPWPLDATVVYLGSYTYRSRLVGKVISDHPLHHWTPTPNRTAPNWQLRRRLLSIPPEVFGALGYIIFRRGARQLHQPVLAPADIGLSYSLHPSPFTNASASYVYSPRSSNKTTAELAPYLELGAMYDMQCVADGRAVRLTVPDNQYMLEKFGGLGIIFPNKSFASGSHEMDAKPSLATSRTTQPERHAKSCDSPCGHARWSGHRLPTGRHPPYHP